MYHNQPNMIELHDDVVGVEKSALSVKEGEPVRLTVTFIMRPNRQYNTDETADVRLHSTNGVNHRYSPMNFPDPALENYGVDTVAEADAREATPILNSRNNLVYMSSDFDPNVSEPTRRLQREQAMVDATTARKRSDGETGAANKGSANSLRAQEVEQPKEDAKHDKHENLKDGDSVRLEHDKKGK